MPCPGQYQLVPASAKNDAGVPSAAFPHAKVMLAESGSSPVCTATVLRGSRALLRVGGSMADTKESPKSQSVRALESGMDSAPSPPSQRRSVRKSVSATAYDRPTGAAAAGVVDGAVECVPQAHAASTATTNADTEANNNGR